MKVLKLWMWIAILTCGLVLTSCSPDSADNPVAPASPEADKYAYSDDIDKSVVPGDDFYQYMIGTWLKNNPKTADKAQGTMELQAEQGEKWLKSVLTSTCPDPAVAELFKRAKTASADRTANLAKLRTKTNAIAALSGREAILKHLGQLMAQGYEPCLRHRTAGDAETFMLQLINFSFEKGNIKATLTNMGFTEEEAKKIVDTVADVDGFMYEDSAFDDDTGGNTGGNDGTDDPMDFRYWWNPDHVRNAIPYTRSRARATRAGEKSAADLIFKGLGVDSKYVLLTSDMTDNVLREIEQASATAKGLEALKGVMQMAVVKRDARYIDMKNESALVNLISLENYLPLRYQLNKLYSEQNITPADRDYVKNMCDEFRATFAKRIQNLDWISDVTKSRALEKLKAVYYFVGIPEKWDNDFILSAPATAGTLYDALVEYDEKFTKMSVKKQPGPGNNSKKDINAMLELGAWESNAFYTPNFNYVGIIACNLIAPITNIKLGDAYNYAVLGANTVGHELTHGFDSRGSAFDGNGKVVDWWAPADKATFVKKQEQLIVHFSQFEAVPGVKLDGKKTITEDIADLGGLSMAIEITTNKCREKGFSKEATDEQLKVFYQSFAFGWKNNSTDKDIKEQIASDDIHSPEKWRVNAQVNNTNEWYNLFGVKAGQKLYIAPEKRVHIW